MPREFVPHYYRDLLCNNPEYRAIVGAELASDGITYFVQFTGGHYSVFNTKQLALALGCPVSRLWGAVNEHGYKILRAIPGLHEQM